MPASHYNGTIFLCSLITITNFNNPTQKDYLTLRILFCIVQYTGGTRCYIDPRGFIKIILCSPICRQDSSYCNKLECISLCLCRENRRRADRKIRSNLIITRTRRKIKASEVLISVCDSMNVRPPVLWFLFLFE